MTKIPQKIFVYKFEKLTSSTFQKALRDFCATYGSYFIDESVPKKSSILTFKEDNFFSPFFPKSFNIHLFYKYNKKLPIYV